VWCKLIRGVEHCVYTPDEFKLKFPEIPIRDNWRDARPGDWVLSDDGKVIQVLKKYSAHKPNIDGYVKYHIIKTCIGVFVNNPGTKMDTDPSRHRQATSFAQRSDLNNVVNRPDCTLKERTFVEFIMAGLSIYESYGNVFHAASRRYLRARARHLFDTERIQKLIQEKVQSACTKLGISEEFVLKHLKDIVVNEEGAVKLGALRELKDVLDMTPEKKLKVLPGRLNFRGAAIEDAEFATITGDAAAGAQKALESGQ
jgi:hypothetical protein